jgi:hypothetical protein
MNETFNSKISVELDNKKFGYAYLKWTVSLITRDYGLAVISPVVHPQAVDLTSGAKSYIDDMEFDLDYIKEQQDNKIPLDKYDEETLKEFNKLKNVTEVDIQEFEVFIESTGYDLSSIGLCIEKMEIDSINKKAKVYFSGNSA